MKIFISGTTEADRKALKALEEFLPGLRRVSRNKLVANDVNVNGFHYMKGLADSLNTKYGTSVKVLPA